MPKHLLSKQQVLELFNPVLDGSCLPGGSTVPITNGPQSLNIYDCAPDMIEMPSSMDCNLDDEVAGRDLYYYGAGRTSLAAWYINGKPLSGWSAQQGGPMTGYIQQNTMQQWLYLQQLGKQLFKNKLYNDDTLEEIKISNLLILKMIPMSGGMGLNMHVKFNLNETEIWGKFTDINIGTEVPQFTSEDLQTFDNQTRITVIGRVWNFIKKWMVPTSGIYKCRAEEVLAFNNVGQMVYVKMGEIIEVLSADEDRIIFNYAEKEYSLRKPTYFWFNWYFDKK